MPGSIRAFGAAAFSTITGYAQSINQGLNGYETELNFIRAYSGLLNAVVKFPKIYKSLTDAKVSEVFISVSNAMSPINETLGELKKGLNFFEFINRVSKLSDTSKLNWQKKTALYFQIKQKVLESFFLEPTSANWGWYSFDKVLKVSCVGSFGRLVGFNITRMGVAIAKEVDVFAASLFSLWGARADVLKTENEIARKTAKVAFLERNVPLPAIYLPANDQGTQRLLASHNMIQVLEAKNVVTEELNKAKLRRERQVVWYSPTLANALDIAEIRKYKIEKKKAQLVNLANDQVKQSWARWFDISKLTIAPLSILMTLKEEGDKTTWLVQQLRETDLGKWVTAGLFLNVIAISLIGLGRTRHLCYDYSKPKSLPPAPLMRAQHA